MASGRGDEDEGSEQLTPQSGIDFRELFQNSPDAVVLIDADQRIILEANRAACDLFAMSREQIVGLHQSQLHPSEDAQKLVAMFEAAGPDGHAVVGDFHVQRPSGEIILAELSASVLELRGRRVVRTVFRELASRRHAQEGVRNRDDQLAALNAIATTVAGSLRLDEIMERALGTVLEVMELEAGVVALLSADQQHVTIAAHRGLSDRLVQLLQGISVDQQLGDKAYLGNSAILMDHLSQDRRLAHLADVLEEEGLHSLAAVPLLAWERGLGTLAVLSRTAGRFSRLDIELVSSIGIQIGMALENASLYRDERRRLSEMEALRKTTLDITRQLDVPSLLDSIVERASALVGATGAGLYLYHPEEQELELVVSQYLDQDYSGTRLKAGEGLSGQVVLTGEPMFIEDYSNWEGRSLKYEGSAFKGVAAVPLKWGSEIVGVVNVTDLGQARAFTDHELQLLELFASQAAIAIKNAQLYQQQEQRYRELVALHETSLHITSRLDLQSVLQAIAARAAKLLDALTAEVYLYRPAEDDLKSSASSGLPPKLVGRHLKPGEGVAGRVLKTGRPLMVDDYDSWEGASPTYTGFGFARVVGVPIRYGKDLLGVLVVDRPLAKPRFRSNDVSLLSLLASQAAIAIENARLHAETRQRLEQLSAIEEVARELSSTLDLRKVIELLLDKAIGATRASAGSIDMVAEDRTYLTWVAHRGYHPHVAERYANSSSMDQGIVGRVARTGQLALVEDVRQDPDYLEAAPGTRSQLTVPIIIENAVAGLIVLESPRLGGFTQEHVDFVQQLAEHAAVAMGNARLYERLRESEERYRAYVESVPDAIWEAGADGRFTYWSPQIESITGYSPQELLGHTPYDLLVHPDNAEQFRRRFRQMMKEGREEYTLRHRVRHRDGAILHLELSVKPVWDDWTEPVKYRGVARDITDQMRLQAQLIQSAKLSGIGQMISGVAHELNNPLTTVMGYTQLLQARDLDESVKADLQRIYNDAVRAQRIVQNLLTFARQQKPQRGPTDINEVIQRTLSLRGDQLKVDAVEIVTELAQDLPWTLADSYQLQQVFLNIINNAHQAMSQVGRGGVLTVSSELVDDDVIRISFKDTGPGIPSEILDRVFDPFFTTKDVGMGTGLGLSVSHGIVEEHGGRIWAQSEAGQGAVFVVELPVRSWAEDLVLASPHADLRQMPSERKRILVVDDEQNLVDLMVRALTDCGYQVDGITDADSAMTKVKVRKYDAIICDIKMPGMAGSAWEKEVTAANPDLAERIIFVIGDVLSSSALAFLEGRESRCLRKPFAMEELRTAVRQVLN